ncbi:hypothetical protein [Gemmobacter sp. 24YEA27]|uniref:hypothetical protein n=1 Tax=Gemmobacter sp. 24YEA27 TaxID=3040672 RepID=UPI0024B35BC4|nr:hypothetical protein [Gemmobacter sp. 24YEA27]
MPAKVVLHLPQRFRDRLDRRRGPLLYEEIRSVITGFGGEVVLAPQLKRADYKMVSSEDLHIVENGRIQRPAVLNAATAYLDGFFHVDPRGIQAESSIGMRLYKPKRIDPGVAAEYFALLRARFVTPRLSRYRQARDHAQLPEGCIAVFLQGPAPQRLMQAACGYDEMLIGVCAGAGGRPVVAKPHPLDPESGQATISAARAAGYEVIATEANIHDILNACALTVSVNSAASIEGLLHEKPGVLFGWSDFHHFFPTASQPGEFAALAERALAAPPDAAKALYWYFGQCLDAKSPDFAPRLLAIFAKAGFDAVRLGLNPPPGQ